MPRQASVGLSVEAAQKRVVKGDVGEFFQPVGTELVQVFPEHFPVVGNHIVAGDFPAEFPYDPVRKGFRFGLPQVAAGDGDALEVCDLLLLRELPDVRFEGVSQFGMGERNA